jgi:hypothetical protein
MSCIEDAGIYQTAPGFGSILFLLACLFAPLSCLVKAKPALKKWSKKRAKMVKNATVFLSESEFLSVELFVSFWMR